MALITFTAGATNKWIQSTDDGVTWSNVSGATTPPQGAGHFIPNGFVVLSNGTWLVIQRDSVTSNKKHFYTSTDSGATWVETAGSPVTFGATPIWAWVDTSIVVILDNDNQHLLVTADNGATITQVTLANTLALFQNNGWGAIVRTSGGRLASVWRDGGNDNHAAYSDNGTIWAFTSAGYPGNGTGGVSDNTPSLAYNAGSGTIIGVQPSTVSTAMKDSDGSGAYTNQFLSANTFGNVWLALVIPPGAAQTTTIAAANVGNSPYSIKTTDGSAWSDLGASSGQGGYGSGFTFRSLYQTPTGAWLLATANGAGTATLYRSTDGIAWSSIASAAGDVLAIMSQTLAGTLVPASPGRGPDQGLPIEIAGPRNDITRLAYKPFVRVFT